MCRAVGNLKDFSKLSTGETRSMDAKLLRWRCRKYILTREYLDQGIS
jgi:hypothetical protein